MNVHICCVYIEIIALVLQHASSKSLQKIDSDHGQNEIASDDALKGTKSDNQRRRRRRGAFDEINNKRQCAVMYKNEQPIGLLQPYKDSYQLLPIHGDESVLVDIGPVDEEINKREAAQESAEEVDKKNEDSSRFSDEKYPYIFAQFKIDSKVEKEQGNRKNLRKREFEHRKPGADSLNSALSKIQTDGDQAEVELKDVLNDMGLIDDARVDKREAEELIEDEDLERGTNKLNLIKMVDNDERRKRNEPVSETYGMIEIPEPKSQNEEQYIDEYINQHPEQLEPLKKKAREKRAEEAANEMERQIKERLQRIKEEVRNEIEAIRGGNNEKGDDEDNNTNSQRKKRNVIATLVDKETSDLDPVLLEEGNLIPHIRRKRHVDALPISTEKRLFLQRNLKEYNDMDYESHDEISETMRDKKSCKCEGKGCKCDKGPALLADASDGIDFVYFDGVPMPASINNNPRPSRNLKDGVYRLDLKPDIYRITEDDPTKTERKKRDLVAIHGGGPVIDHLVAVRERSMMPRMRVKRTAADQTGRPLTLTDMSDEDLFGALPESFEGGELARYKRVK